MVPKSRANSRKQTSVTNTLVPWAIMLLLCCMSMPSIASLAHALYEHQDRECSKEARLHFHTAEFNCEFQKVKNTPHCYHHPEIVPLRVVRYFAHLPFREYIFVNPF